MRILITGASGQLGAYLLDESRSKQLEIIAWSGRYTGSRSGYPLQTIDLLDLQNLRHQLDLVKPEAVIHAAAVSAAEDVRRDPRHAYRLNVDATSVIADWCHDHNSHLIFTSTDLVFDGTQAPYNELAGTNPVLEYGRTKATAEAVVNNRGLIVRVSLLYGTTRCGRPSFFDRAISLLQRNEPQVFFADEFRTPLDYRTAASALLQLTLDRRYGIVHLAGAERMSRHILMTRAATAMGLPKELVLSNRRIDATLPEPRPADVSLDTSRLAEWLPDLQRPSVEEALRQS